MGFSTTLDANPNAHVTGEENLKERLREYHKKQWRPLSDRFLEFSALSSNRACNIRLAYDNG